jgi:hypothetical protein
MTDTEDLSSPASRVGVADRPDTDPAAGTPVVVVGLVEAVSVCDGQFTPVLLCAEFPRAITLEISEDMREQTLGDLCRWIEVSGRLHAVAAGRYRLEAHRMRTVQPSGGSEER